MMIIEDEAKYSFEKSYEVFKESTLKAGWKIATIHDLQATMKKFGKDVNKAVVFEICHPEHAYKILSKDGERVVTSLMPCRVAFYERNGKVYLSRLNSGLMGKMMDGVVPEVMNSASVESEAILKSVIK